MRTIFIETYEYIQDEWFKNVYNLSECFKILKLLIKLITHINSSWPNAMELNLTSQVLLDTLDEPSIFFTIVLQPKHLTKKMLTEEFFDP